MNGQEHPDPSKGIRHRILDTSTKEIVSRPSAPARCRGSIPLPTKIEKFTVNRSPHIDKKSREPVRDQDAQARSRHRRPTPQTVDALMKLDLAAGVESDQL